MPLPVFAVLAALLFASTPLLLPSSAALAEGSSGGVILAGHDMDDEAYDDNDEADEAYDEDDRDESADLDDEDDADDDEGDEAAYGRPDDDRRA